MPRPSFLRFSRFARFFKKYPSKPSARPAPKALSSRRAAGCALLTLSALLALTLFVFRPGERAVSAAKEDETLPSSVTLAGKRVLPVYGVARTDRAVALTIDAAWGGDKTPEILSILKEKQAPATFFLVGRWIREFPDLTRAIAEAGHVIGSHSDSHPHLCSLSDSQIQTELSETAAALTDLGLPAPTLFRPPFGEYDDRVVTALRSAGYQVIQWSVDTLDWKEERTASQVMETVARKIEPGAILLCHNNANTIAEYLGELIDFLRGEGYTLVSLPELLYDGFSIDNNGVQHPPETAN